MHDKSLGALVFAHTLENLSRKYVFSGIGRTAKNLEASQGSGKLQEATEFRSAANRVLEVFLGSKSKTGKVLFVNQCLRNHFNT